MNLLRRYPHQGAAKRSIEPLATVRPTLCPKGRSRALPERRARALGKRNQDEELPLGPDASETFLIKTRPWERSSTAGA